MEALCQLSYSPEGTTKVISARQNSNALDPNRAPNPTARCAQVRVCGAGAGGCTHEYRNGDMAAECMEGSDDGCASSQNNHYRICVCNRY